MKTIKYAMLAVIASLSLTSCVSDGDDIGAPLEVYDDSSLLHGDASDAANARIKEIHDKYGSYVYYNFTDKDALWAPNTGMANNFPMATTLGDPKNVDAMLDYINDIWLKYFNDDFKKNGGIPYRVFLADSLYTIRDYGGGNIYHIPSNYKITGNSIIIAGMNQVPTMDAATKTSRKSELMLAIWDYYRQHNVITIPDEFYEGTDYITEPSYTVEVVSPWYSTYTYDVEGLRNRGFIPSRSQYGYNSEIVSRSGSWTSWNTEETNKTADYNAYMSQIFLGSDEDVATYLAYPAVKRKWDILVNYYKEQYNLDLRAIAKE